MADTPKLLTANEAAKILRKNPWWVTRQCREGSLRASLYGGTWHISEDAIAEFVEANTNRPVPSAAPRRRKQRRAS